MWFPELRYTASHWPRLFTLSLPWGRGNDLSLFSFHRRGKGLRNKEPFSEVAQLFRGYTELKTCPVGSESSTFPLSKHHALSLSILLTEKPSPASGTALLCSVCRRMPPVHLLQEVFSDYSCPLSPSTHSCPGCKLWALTKNSSPCVVIIFLDVISCLSSFIQENIYRAPGGEESEAGKGVKLCKATQKTRLEAMKRHSHSVNI